MRKVIGKNYLHTHPREENAKGIDNEHCIVDKKELQEVQKFFEDNPQLIQWIGKGSIHWDANTGRVFNVDSNHVYTVVDQDGDLINCWKNKEDAEKHAEELRTEHGTYYKATEQPLF